MIDKRGRGRLSSIEQLPPEADPHIQWAVEELQARQRSQADILFELNDRLAAIGCEEISSSAFNRYSMRMASMQRRLQETREIAKAVTARLGPDAADDTTIMLVEMLKTAAYSILETGTVDALGVSALANGLKSALAAQKVSADVRRKKEAEIAARVEEVVDAAGKAAGLPADRIAQLRREFLGVRPAS